MTTARRGLAATEGMPALPWRKPSLSSFTVIRTPAELPGRLGDFLNDFRYFESCSRIRRIDGTPNERLDLLMPYRDDLVSLHVQHAKPEVTIGSIGDNVRILRGLYRSRPFLIALFHELVVTAASKRHVLFASAQLRQGDLRRCEIQSVIVPSERDDDGKIRVFALVEFAEIVTNYRHEGEEGRIELTEHQ